MKTQILSLLALAGVILAGCGNDSKTATPEAPPAASAGATSEPSPEKKPAQACEMVTLAEMSAILGSEVVAKNNDHSTGKTECIYTSVREGGPYVELSVSWGDGEAAMMGVGFLNSKEPGIASPYDGIGDQAIAVGTTLMIKTGEDLMHIVFSGVEDAPGAAKQIYTTAKARM